MRKCQQTIQLINFVSYFSITFVVTAYRNSSHTNARRLADSIQETLIELKTLFLASNL